MLCVGAQPASLPYGCIWGGQATLSKNPSRLLLRRAALLALPLYQVGQAEQPGWPDRGLPCIGGSLHLQAEARLPCSAGYYGRPFEARNKTKGGAFAADKDYFSFRVGDQQVSLLGGAKRECLGANCWLCACCLVPTSNPSFARASELELLWHIASTWKQGPPSCQHLPWIMTDTPCVTACAACHPTIPGRKGQQHQLALPVMQAMKGLHCSYTQVTVSQAAKMVLSFR